LLFEIVDWKLFEKKNPSNTYLLVTWWLLKPESCSDFTYYNICWNTLHMLYRMNQMTKISIIFNKICEIMMLSWQDNDNTIMFSIETPKRESGLVKIISVYASLDSIPKMSSIKIYYPLKWILNTNARYAFILFIQYSIALFEDYVGGNDIIIIYTFTRFWTF